MLCARESYLFVCVCVPVSIRVVGDHKHTAAGTALMARNRFGLATAPNCIVSFSEFSGQRVGQRAVTL